MMAFTRWRAVREKALRDRIERAKVLTVEEADRLERDAFSERERLRGEITTLRRELELQRKIQTDIVSSKSSDEGTLKQRIAELEKELEKTKTEKASSQQTRGTAEFDLTSLSVKDLDEVRQLLDALESFDPDPIDIGQLAHRMNESTSRTQYRIDIGEMAKLVETQKNNGGVLFVSLTPTGRRLLFNMRTP